MNKILTFLPILFGVFIASAYAQTPGTVDHDTGNTSIQITVTTDLCHGQTETYHEKLGILRQAWNPLKALAFGGFQACLFLPGYQMPEKARCKRVFAVCRGFVTER